MQKVKVSFSFDMTFDYLDLILILFSVFVLLQFHCALSKWDQTQDYCVYLKDLDSKIAFHVSEELTVGFEA